MLTYEEFSRKLTEACVELNNTGSVLIARVDVESEDEYDEREYGITAVNVKELDNVMGFQKTPKIFMIDYANYEAYINGKVDFQVITEKYLRFITNYALGIKEFIVKKLTSRYGVAYVKGIRVYPSVALFRPEYLEKSSRKNER